MPDLSIHLLGPFHVSYQDQTVSGFRSERERALLAFLLVEGDRPHRRQELLGLLWPELPEVQARNNLRVNLHRLRKVLEKATGDKDVLLVGRDVVQLNPSFPIWLDVAAFQASIAQAELIAQTQNQAKPERLQQLTSAVTLYRDEFLTGFAIDDSPAFTHWTTTMREQLHGEALYALYELAEMHRRRGELREALPYVRRQLELEPWREKAHRQLMGILARSGERSAALGQFRNCRRILLEEFGVEPAVETINLFERIQAMGKHQLTNFPAQSTPFVGRKRELAMVAERLANPACRLLTITGPGGSGKTRLALQAAKHQVGAFLHGVVLIPLADVSTPELLVSSIAGALALPSESKRSPKKQLLEYLREKDLLLLFDNFEHLLPAARLLGEILEEALELKLVATSRERLNLHGEWLLELDGLRYPQDDEADGVEDYSAVQLFLQTGQRVQPGFSLTEHPEVVRICQLVAGMPLGIELAAARVREYSCREIEEKIRENLDLLTTTMRDASPRHRSLRAVMTHSWELLDDEEKLALPRLSVFRGGFTREAARRVAGASLTVLSALVDKSLLRRTILPGGKTASARYDMHELIRQFAAEKLEQVPAKNAVTEKENVQNLYGNYYMMFLGERASHVWDENGSLALEAHLEIEKVRVEIENVRAAWRWAIEHGRVKEIGDALLLWMYFFEHRGWFLEAEQTYALVVRRLDGLVGVAAEPDQEVLSVLGLALFCQGWYVMRLSSYETAATLIGRGIDIAHRSGDRELEVYCLDGLGLVAILQGAFASAKKYLQECYQICLEIDQNWMAAGALTNLGRTAMLQGDYEEAKQFVLEGLAMKKQLGDMWGIATRTDLLGQIAVRSGDYKEAEALIKKSMALYKEIGLQWRMTDGLNSLAHIAFQRGAYAESKEFYLQSLSLAREVGEREKTAMVLSLLGEVNIALEETRVAERRFQEALGIAVAIQALPAILRAMLGLGTLLAQKGKSEEAVEILVCIQRHPAVEQTVQEGADRLLNKLEAELPPEMVASAIQRGESRQLDDLIRQQLK